MILVDRVRVNKLITFNDEQDVDLLEIVSKFETFCFSNADFTNKTNKKAIYK